MRESNGTHHFDTLLQLINMMQQHVREKGMSTSDTNRTAASDRRRWELLEKCFVVADGLQLQHLLARGYTFIYNNSILARKAWNTHGDGYAYGLFWGMEQTGG